MTASLDLGDTMMVPVGPEASEPIRVLVCAAHAHMQWGLRKLVEGEWPRMLLVATVSSLADAESYLRSHPTEVALLDFPEPSEEMFSNVARLCQSFPTSFLMLDGNAEVMDRLTGAGVKAVLPLDAPAEEILGAVYHAVGTSYEH